MKEGTQMKTMLSGIKPSGPLTLGNYIGALKPFVSYQDDYHVFAFIANLHCITVYQDPAELTTNLRDCVALYLACGLDPKKTTIFLQSDVLEHAQLGWILNCNTNLGELNRMTQYKDKVAKNEVGISAGLYTYPTLMAADILMYDADFVPVGEDQKQHVELARDIALRFNHRYGETFKVPEPLIPTVGKRIMSLSDPTKKMSKSDHDKGCIMLLDDLKVARKKIMAAVTDSLGVIAYDPVNQAGLANLMSIHSVLSGESIDSLVARFEGKGYGDFKKEVANVVCAELEKIQAAYHNIIQQNVLGEVLQDGANQARTIAQAKLKVTQKVVGLEIVDGIDS